MSVQAVEGLSRVKARIEQLEGLLAGGTTSTTTGTSSTGTLGASSSASAFADTLVQALAGTASTGTQNTTPSSGGSPTDLGQKAVTLAKEYTGVPYLWGGTNPAKGLDCSGLVQLVYRKLGIDLPRVSQQQEHSGKAVASLSQARPGDLVFFGSPATHVGIYVGNGKMIDAPRTGEKVGIHKLWRTPSAIRRVVPEVPQTPSTAQTSGAGRTAANAMAAQSAALLAAFQAGAAYSAQTSLLSGSAVSSLLSGSTANSLLSGSTTGSLLSGSTAASLLSGAMAAAGLRSAALTAAAAPAVAASAAAASVSASSASTGATSRTSQAASSSSRSSVGLSGPYSQLFTAAGKKYGVDPALLSAVAKAESGYRSDARSPAGALGLMQLMPATARSLKVDPLSPAQAVDGAARLLAGYLKDHPGRIDLALASYNAGPGAVKRYGGVPPYPETQTYVQRVKRNWEALR